MAIRENPRPRLLPATVGAAAVAPAAPLRRDGRAMAAANQAAGRPAPARPDPKPMRFAIAAGGLATLSALLATIASSTVPTATPAITVQKDSPAEVALVRHVTRVVKLPPGATAPPAGSNVIVTQLPAPVSKPKTVVVRTTQSGTVIKP